MTQGEEITRRRAIEEAEIAALQATRAARIAQEKATTAEIDLRRSRDPTA